MLKFHRHFQLLLCYTNPTTCKVFLSISVIQMQKGVKGQHRCYKSWGKDHLEKGADAGPHCPFAPDDMSNLLQTGTNWDQVIVDLKKHYQFQPLTKMMKHGLNRQIVCFEKSAYVLLSITYELTLSHSGLKGARGDFAQLFCFEREAEQNWRPGKPSNLWKQENW